MKLCWVIMIISLRIIIIMMIIMIIVITSVHKILYFKDTVDWLYLKWKDSGRSLVSIEEYINSVLKRGEDNTRQNNEGLIRRARICSRTIKFVDLKIPDAKPNFPEKDNCTDISRNNQKVSQM